MKKEHDVCRSGEEVAMGRELLRYTAERLPQYGWLQGGVHTPRAAREGAEKTGTWS